jgi:hypothetical protein
MVLPIVRFRQNLEEGERIPAIDLLTQLVSRDGRPAAHRLKRYMSAAPIAAPTNAAPTRLLWSLS